MIRRLVPACLLLLVTWVIAASISPPFAQEMLVSLAVPEGLNGSWRIDVDRTLAENEKWQQAYNAHGPEEKTIMRSTMAGKVLVVDLKAKVLEEKIDDAVVSRQAVSDLLVLPGGMQMTAIPEEAEPYSLVMTLIDSDMMKIVIEDSAVLILHRVP